jgi:hypothetical protein
LPAGIQAVQEGHTYVQHDDVGTKVAGDGKHGTSVANCANDVTFRFQQLAAGLYEEPMVISEQNTWAQHDSGLLMRKKG